MYRVDQRPPVLFEEPPARGLPRPVRWLIGLVVATLVGGIAAAGATAIVVFQQYPATVSAPDTVLGMPRQSAIIDEMYTPAEKEMMVRVAGRYGDGFLEAYADGTTPATTHKMAVIMVEPRLVLRPASDLTAALTNMSSSVATVGDIADVPPGELGGSAACLNTRANGRKVPMVYCGWADHGSIGLVIVIGAKDRDEAARWMLDIREAVVTR